MTGSLDIQLGFSTVCITLKGNSPEEVMQEAKILCRKLASELETTTIWPPKIQGFDEVTGSHVCIVAVATDDLEGVKKACA